MEPMGIEAMGMRLDRLERENRRLRRVGLCSAVGAILLLICGAFYFLISFPLARLGGYLERRWSND